MSENPQSYPMDMIPNKDSENKVSSVVFGIATPQRISEIIGFNPDIRFLTTWENQSGNPDSIHPLGQWSTLTTPDQPAVIYDDGAAFCSPVIVCDGEGNALHFHDSLIGYSDYGEAAQTYFNALPSYLKSGEHVGCIAGANVNLTEQGEAAVISPIDELIDFVDTQIRQRIPLDNFTAYVSKQYANQRRRCDLIPDNEKVRGFTFIPKYLTRDNRNYLFAILDNQAKALRTAFKIGKR